MFMLFCILSLTKFYVSDVASENSTTELVESLLDVVLDEIPETNDVYSTSGSWSQQPTFKPSLNTSKDTGQ